jgi:ABC-type multidrug transport system ATPase subunit
VAFVCRINGDSRKQIERRTDFVESFADVGRYFDMPMNTYSSGMRSRVSFGMSMAFDFDMYLVDEVTSVGDGDFQKKCNAVFDQKRAGMSGMILVSHSMSLVEKWCDRAVYIDRGEVKVYENLSEAIGDQSLGSPARLCVGCHCSLRNLFWLSGVLVSRPVGVRFQGCGQECRRCGCVHFWFWRLGGAESDGP